MRQYMFLLLSLGTITHAQGQQVISSVGGAFDGGPVRCELSVGEVRFGADESPAGASIQIVPGVFSPSEGIIVPTGNEVLPSGEPPFRLSFVGGRLCLETTDETSCRIYSVKGELLHESLIRSGSATLPSFAGANGILFVRLEQDDYCVTYKIVIP